MWTLSGSYLFYGWWDWRFLTLIIISSSVDFFLGFAISAQDNNLRRRQLLWLSILMNLGFLGFFKYFDFFVHSFVQLLESFGLQPGIHSLNIILPVGISFYTFQSMSYTIDVYQRKLEPESDFLRFATFVAFWPQLVAGPIVRAGDFLPQLRRNHQFENLRLIKGIGQILWGFFKKVAIADSLAPFVDQVFSEPGTFSSVNLWLALFYYAFQIYCDFSGYSDIAIGFARIMGFDFPANFRTPYFSKNFSEFWTRWHISLSSWLRDYLYISLGGNKLGKAKTYRNLMVTMLLGGLWHGANWTFVAWGFLHGIFLVVQRFWTDFNFNRLKLPANHNHLILGIKMLIVFSFTCLAWVFFRSPDVGVAMDYLKGMMQLEGFDFVNVMNKFTVVKGMFLITILVAIEILHIRMNLSKQILQNPGFRIAAFAVLLWFIAFFGTFDSNAFIYFQF